VQSILFLHATDNNDWCGGIANGSAHNLCQIKPVQPRHSRIKKNPVEFFAFCPVSSFLAASWGVNFGLKLLEDVFQHVPAGGIAFDNK